MSKGRTSLDLLVASEADGIAVRNRMATFLAGMDIFRRDTDLIAFQDKDLNWRVAGDIRFNNRSDAESFKSLVEAQWTTGLDSRRIKAASLTNFHVCPHDERPPYYDCKVATRAEFSEARK